MRNDQTNHTVVSKLHDDDEESAGTQRRSLLSDLPLRLFIYLHCMTILLPSVGTFMERKEVDWRRGKGGSWVEV